MTITAASVASIAARCLRTTGAVDPDTPLALLGLDSLGTIEMAAELETAFKCELPPDLLTDCVSARSLAARISALREARSNTERLDPFEAMVADAELPDDVWPVRSGHSRTDLRSARRILLTGATGFLGGALLGELLAATAAEILCLVRDTSRIPHPSSRVRVVTGDLSHPRLGLGQMRFDRLADDIDAVIHCGAAVNWVYTYAGLRAANVSGTLELLRLACRRGVPFHFISSLSVCYPAEGPRHVDEDFEALPHLRGVYLGYAQSKVVAEALIRRAGARGLPVRIYRPALISGHSTSGAFNRDDLITALVRGCAHMGTAPDLDWNLDCQPVDVVAKAIVRLSGGMGPVFHLGHGRPRHWRECVLWMRMYGYHVRLVPYHAWLRQLVAETRPAADHAATHPLRPLRTFFLNRHAEARGLTLPELYEESRRTSASSARTLSALATAGVVQPALDAGLLDTYFEAFRAAGELPPPATVRHGSTRATAQHGSTRFNPGLPAVALAKAGHGSTRLNTGHVSTRATVQLGSTRLKTDPCWSVDELTLLLGRRVASATVLGSGSEHSIVSELTTWRARRRSGLFAVQVTSEDGSEARVRLKAKAEDTDVIAVGEALAAMTDPAVGAAYATWRDRAGFTASHVREIEIYRQADPRFRRHAPALLGSAVDDGAGRWLMALEDLSGARLLNSAGTPGAWRRCDIAAALDGLASLHAIWYEREAELRRMPWIGYVQSTAGMAEMHDLWTALAAHAAPAFSSWADPGVASLQRRLVATIPQWWGELEAGPRTLIHNDFNPRNVCLRNGALCAYDWELATIGAPQHDLAEFLCFVLAPGSEAGEIQGWIDHSRLALERETGRRIDTADWLRGFRAALYDLMLNRLPTYAVVHRVRRQAFLPRVVRTWWRLYQHFPLEDCE